MCFQDIFLISVPKILYVINADVVYKIFIEG